MTLKTLRQQSGKTVKEVAEKLKVTSSAVFNYEAGLRSISIEQVLVLSELFDCTAEEVINAQLSVR